MTRFIHKSFTFGLPLFIVLISVNYFGDAAKIFNSKYEDVIANYLSQGKNVTNITNYDERILQKKIARFTSFKPDILVLGSSRSMMIRSSSFDASTLLNCSVSGASLEDLVGIYQIYKDQNILPNRVIVGIDPWTLMPQKKGGRWESISDYVTKFCQSTPEPYYGKVTQLFSFSYFQSSLKELIKKLTEGSKPLATIEKYNENNTKLTDGSLVYGKSYRNITSKERSVKIEKYISTGIYGIEGFGDIPKYRIELLEKLFNELRDNQVTFQIFLAPYPPKVYNFLIKENYSIVFETEKLIRELAEMYNFGIYGSFNPDYLNFDDSYFFDGMHCTEKGVNKILSKGAN